MSKHFLLVKALPVVLVVALLLYFAPAPVLNMVDGAEVCEGVVVDAKGAPIAHARVGASYELYVGWAPTLDGWFSTHTVRVVEWTDSEGHFRVVLRGHWRMLFVSDAVSASEVVPLKGAKDKRRIVVVLEDAIQGLGEEDGPITNAAVVLPLVEQDGNGTPGPEAEGNGGKQTEE